MRSAPEAAATGRAVSTARLSGLDTTVLSGHSAKYLAERGGLGLTGRVQRDVELSSEHAGGIESRLAVSDEEDVHHYHA